MTRPKASYHLAKKEVGLGGSLQKEGLLKIKRLKSPKSVKPEDQKWIKQTPYDEPSLLINKPMLNNITIENIKNKNRRRQTRKRK